MKLKERKYFFEDTIWWNVIQDYLSSYEAIK